MKKTLKYQLSDLKIAILTYYAIYLAIIALAGFVSSQARADGSQTMFGATDFSAAVFIFVMGLAIFKEHFWMAAQNGISRRTFFKSCMCCMVIVSFILAAASLLCSVMIIQIWGLNYQTTLDLIYPALHPDTAKAIFINLCFSFFAFALCFIIGYFITILFYRASKTVKIIIAAGLPVTIFFLLPLSTQFFPNFWKKVLQILLAITGIKNDNPFYGILTFAVITAALTIFSYPLVKKVEV